MAEAGARRAPPPAGLGKPTTAPQTALIRLQSIRLRLLTVRRARKRYQAGCRDATTTITMRDTDKQPDIRCAHCGRKLGEGYALDLTIKCPRCGAYNTLRAARPCSEPSDGQIGTNYDYGLSL